MEGNTNLILWGYLGLHGAGQGGTNALSALGLALKQGLTVLVHVQLGDDDVTGMNANRHSLTVDLLTSQAIYVDDVLAAIGLVDLALTTLVRPADDHDIVVLSHGHRTHVVLDPKLLAQRGAHDHPADMTGSREVGLAGLSA
jgi:hypothetical protein